MNVGTFFGAAHYDHNLHEHYHFVCDRCRLVFDVNDYLPALAEQVAGMDDFMITGLQLTFSGICRYCNGK